METCAFIGHVACVAPLVAATVALALVGVVGIVIFVNWATKDWK